MSKSELISLIADKNEVSKKDAEKSLNMVVDAITCTLAEGGKIQLSGFGVFEVRERAERQGKNPQTKETITIKASKSPVFKAGKALKDTVNN